MTSAKKIPFWAHIAITTMLQEFNVDLTSLREDQRTPIFSAALSADSLVNDEIEKGNLHEGSREAYINAAVFDKAKEILRTLQKQRRRQ